MFRIQYFLDGSSPGLLTEPLLFLLKSIAFVPERSISSPFGPIDAVDTIGDASALSTTGLPGLWNIFLYRNSAELGAATSRGVMLNISNRVFGSLFAPGGGGEVGWAVKEEKKPERVRRVVGVVG